MLWMGMFFLERNRGFQDFPQLLTAWFLSTTVDFCGDPGFPPSHLLSYVDIFHTDFCLAFPSSINFHQLPNSPPRWYATLDLLTGIKNSKTESITQEGDDFLSVEPLERMKIMAFCLGVSMV